MKAFTERQKQIIDISIGIIAERGIQELTIKNLSRLLGISEPAIYRHFESKTDILLGILSCFEDRSRAAFGTAAQSGKSGRESLQAVLKEHFRFIAGYPALSGVLFSEEIFQNERELSGRVFSMMEGARKTLEDILLRGMSDGSVRADVPAEHLALLVLGTLRFTVNRWHLSGYSFDLIQEGEAMCSSMDRLLMQQV